MSADRQSIAARLLAANRDSRASVGLSQETDLTPLQFAALYEPPTAEKMIASGVTWDLHSAVALGNVAEIERLSSTSTLASEADLLPPLGFALLRGQTDAVATLLRCGDDANRGLRRAGFFEWEVEALGLGPWRPIHLAAVHGYHDCAPAMVRMLVEHGADLHAPSVLGDRAIHLACTYDWTEVLATLLDLGDDVNARTTPAPPKVHEMASPRGAKPDHDLTPLMVAAREGMAKSARKLIARGADVNARSALKSTALHIAASAWWREDVEVVDILLRAGADPGSRDENGNTPLDYARERNYANIAAKLTQSA